MGKGGHPVVWTSLHRTKDSFLKSKTFFVSSSLSSNLSTFSSLSSGFLAPNLLFTMAEASEPSFVVWSPLVGRESREDVTKHVLPLLPLLPQALMLELMSEAEWYWESITILIFFLSTSYLLSELNLAHTIGLWNLRGYIFLGFGRTKKNHGSMWTQYTKNQLV